MKIKAIKEFIDRENDMIHRKIGETFEAGKLRAEHLERLGFVENAEKKGVLHIRRVCQEKCVSFLKVR